MANKIQILRNASIATSRDDAKSALNAQLAKLSDGEIAIARYGEGEGESKTVKVLLGFSYKAEGATSATPYIFDADGIPADVQAEITKLIGTDSDTKDSVTIKGAKKYADALVEALDVDDSIAENSFVASVSETDGKITVTKGAVTSTNGTVTITAKKDAQENLTGELSLDVNIDGTTIVKDETSGKLSVASSALTQYVGSNAVSVSEVSADKNEKTISLGIDQNDKVLTQSTSGLVANISMSYDETNRLINLTGKSYTEEGTEKAYSLGSIDASKFIKDGMLAGETVFVATSEKQSVTINEQTHEFTDLTVGKHYIVFMFSTYDGTTQKTDYSWDILDATSIIDVYKAGDGLALGTDGHTFSVTIDSNSEKYLTVVEYGGVKLSGVGADIAKAKSTVTVGDTEAHVSVTSSEDTTDGHTIYTIESVDTASATDLNSLVTATGLSKTEGETTTTIAYTAPTASGVFKDTTSVMDMLNAIDAAWNTIDCGTYGEN